MRSADSAGTSSNEQKIWLDLIPCGMRFPLVFYSYRLAPLQPCVPNYALLKEGGTKGIGKVFALLLAAFAMTMIRAGIIEWMKRTSL